MFDPLQIGKRSIASTLLGRGRQYLMAVAVTATSSSMRMPMPFRFIDLRLTFGRSQAITDVSPGSTVSTMRAQSHRSLAQAIGADVMHVETTSARHAYRVAIVAVSITESGSPARAEVQQSLHQHAQGGVVDLFRGGPDDLTPPLLGRQHKAVELPLLR